MINKHSAKNKKNKQLNTRAIASFGLTSTVSIASFGGMACKTLYVKR
jgi:hypothetical protein